MVLDLDLCRLAIWGPWSDKERVRIQYVTAEVALKVDAVKIREVADEIAEFDEVGYVVICAGSYDILMEVACADNDSLINFISNKLARVDGVRSSEIHMYLRIVKNTYQWGVP